MLRQRRGTGARVPIQRLKSWPNVDYDRVSRGFVDRPDAWPIEEKKKKTRKTSVPGEHLIEAKEQYGFRSSYRSMKGVRR